MTEKASVIYNFLVENQINKKFSAAELSEMIGEKVAPATLTSMYKKGILQRFDSTPKTYQLSEEGSYNTIEGSTSKKASGKDAITSLFELASNVESQVDAIIHWMESDNYASEPGTQVGIYGIVSNDIIIYVGKTERPFEQRWQEHKKLLDLGKHHSPELQKFFDNLGKDFSKITFKILQELPKDPKIIDLRERFWIEKNKETILNLMRPKLKK